MQSNDENILPLATAELSRSDITLREVLNDIYKREEVDGSNTQENLAFCFNKLPSLHDALSSLVENDLAHCKALINWFSALKGVLYQNDPVLAESTIEAINTLDEQGVFHWVSSSVCEKKLAYQPKETSIIRVSPRILPQANSVSLICSSKQPTEITHSIASILRENDRFRVDLGNVVQVDKGKSVLRALANELYRVPGLRLLTRRGEIITLDSVFGSLYSTKVQLSPSKLAAHHSLNIERIIADTGEIMEIKMPIVKNKPTSPQSRYTTYGNFSDDKEPHSNQQEPVGRILEPSSSTVAAANSPSAKDDKSSHEYVIKKYPVRTGSSAETARNRYTLFPVADENKLPASVIAGEEKISSSTPKRE